MDDWIKLAIAVGVPALLSALATIIVLARKLGRFEGVDAKSHEELGKQIEIHTKDLAKIHDCVFQVRQSLARLEARWEERFRNGG